MMKFVVEYDEFHLIVIDFVVVVVVLNTDEVFLFLHDLVYLKVLVDNQHLVLMVILRILLVPEKVINLFLLIYLFVYVNHCFDCFIYR